MRADPDEPPELPPPNELLVDHTLLSVPDCATVRGLRMAGPGRSGPVRGPRPVYWLAHGDLKRIGGSMLLRIADEVRNEGAVLLLSGSGNPLAEPVRATVPQD